MRTHRPVAVLALCAVIALSACGDGGPSIRAEPDATTTSTEPEPTTSTTAGEPTTTTTQAVDGQVVRYQGLQFVVPADWVVYDLAAAPTTCVRADRHAVYLGTPGPKPDCPAHVVGHTETVLLTPLATASQIAVARATEGGVLNGIAVRTDPKPDSAGALTVVLPDLGLAAFITFGGSIAVANEIAASFSLIAP